MRLSLSLCLAFLLAEIAFAADAKRPNILFIYTDDQPYKTLSCYPESPAWVKTPNIDKLAARGVRFTRGYIGAWCMPARASLLTGGCSTGSNRCAWRASIPAAPTIRPSARSSRRCSARTATRRRRSASGTPAPTPASAAIGTIRSSGTGRPIRTTPAITTRPDPLLQRRRSGRCRATRRTTTPIGPSSTSRASIARRTSPGTCGSATGPSTDRPRRPSGIKASYAGNAAPVPKDIFGPWPDKPTYLEKAAAWEPGKSGKPIMKGKAPRKGNFDKDEAGLKYDDWVQQVNECAMAIDEGVARVMKALEASGQLANTLVVYTADQGYGLGRARLQPEGGRLRRHDRLAADHQPARHVARGQGLPPSGELARPGHAVLRHGRRRASLEDARPRHPPAAKGSRRPRPGTRPRC